MGVEQTEVKQMEEHLLIPFHCLPGTVYSGDHGIALVYLSHVHVIFWDWLRLPLLFFCDLANRHCLLGEQGDD